MIKLCVLFLVATVVLGSPKPKTLADCGPGTFECPNGAFCITEDQLCDGFPDCIVGEDEEGDDPQCCEFGLRCNSGRCLALNRVCDGYNDCGDWMDEQQNCTGTTVTPCHGFFC